MAGKYKSEQFGGKSKSSPNASEWDERRDARDCQIGRSSLGRLGAWCRVTLLCTIFVDNSLFVRDTRAVWLSPNASAKSTTSSPPSFNPRDTRLHLKK